MKRLLSIALAIAVLMMVLPALAEAPPEIIVTAGEKEIPAIIGLNLWDNATYDWEDTFETLAKEGTDFPIVGIGDEVTITFPAVETFPQTVELFDYLLYFYEDELYNPGVSNALDPIEFLPGASGMTATVVISEHFLRLASSRIEDFSPGASIRGFRLICGWENGNQCEYAFAIRV